LDGIKAFRQISLSTPSQILPQFAAQSTSKRRFLEYTLAAVFDQRKSALIKSIYLASHQGCAFSGELNIKAPQLKTHTVFTYALCIGHSE
jgi:hypothetical protein